MSKKLLAAILCLVLVLPTFAGCESEKSAATVLVNGVIYTVEGQGWDTAPVQAMAMDSQGKITFVGSTEDAQEFIGNDTEVVELDGKTVLPGFIDSHVHAPGTALTQLFQIDLFSSFTKENTMAAIKEYIEKNPDLEAYFGTGFNMGMVDENGAAPNAAWLDEICSDKPVILQSNDMHSMLVNSKAMEVSGIDKSTTTESEGNIHRFADGTPTGLFTDVTDLKLPEAEYTKEQQTKAVVQFINTMNEWGYTSIMSIAPLFGIEYERYTDAEATGDLKLRVNMAQFMDPENPEQSLEDLIAMKETLESDLIKVDTAKYMLDGVVEGYTAYLKAPYDPAAGLGDDYNALPTWTYEELEASYQEAMKAGFQTHTHSIGDAATTMCLDAIEEAQTTLGEGDYRNVITHLQVVDQADYQRFGELKIIAAIQTFWHLMEPDWYENVDKIALGAERAWNEYPAQSLVDNGAIITASGDFPVSALNNPFFGIEAGVTRNIYSEEYYGFDIEDVDDPTYLLNSEERLTVPEMIEAYTINGAYQLFREKETGSLAVGKYADFIITDADPLKADVLDLDGIQVLTTVFGGEVAYGQY